MADKDKRTELRELLENATREELYKTIYQLMGAVTALKIALAKTESQIKLLTKGMENNGRTESGNSSEI